MNKYNYINTYNDLINNCISFIKYYNILQDPKVKVIPSKPTLLINNDFLEDDNLNKLKEYLTILSNINPKQNMDKLEEELSIYQDYIRKFINAYGIGRAIANKHITDPKEVGYPGSYWINLIK